MLRPPLLFPHQVEAHAAAAAEPWLAGMAQGAASFRSSSLYEELKMSEARAFTGAVSTHRFL